MKIAVDISQIVYAGTGVARYTQMLVDAILKYDKENEYHFFFSSLRRNPSHEIPGLKRFFFPPTLLDLFWNRLHILPIESLIGKVDTFLSSDWTQPPTRAKKITVVHDLVYLKYPQTLPPKIIEVQTRRMNWVKKEVDLIIADSQSTKQDLIDLLKISPEKIKVIYPALVIAIPPRREKQSLPTQARPFILSVGKLEPRKNIPRLISAFQKANLKDVDLIIVGPRGWDSEKFQIPNNVKLLGFVPDSELYSLYSNALFFVYPSLYEGFGYPVVEAMSFGCPVATSNTSSLKEIGKDNALLFNPESEEEIKDAIVTLYEDKDLRSKLSSAGKKRAKDFSLENFANEFIKAIV